MKFVRTTAINKILKLRKRIKVIQGGGSAGKTIGIIAKFIDKAAKNPGREISIVSRDMPHLKKGAIKDFKKIMKITGRWNGDHWHDTDKKYTFSNGAYIEFFGLDDEDKARGPRRDDLYINEADRITFSTYKNLASRTGGEIVIDYNPTGRFWAHEELIGNDNVDFIVLTYLDNEARPENVDEEMADAKRKHDEGKSPYWINYWRVYGLGLIGQLRGAIWTDWSELDELPKDAEFVGLGLDFGYTNSQTAVVGIYKWSDPKLFSGFRYVFDEWIYETGLKNKNIAQMILSFPQYDGEEVYCDSAEPKSIDTLCDYGVNAHPCASKTDIHEYAIDHVGAEHFYITSQSKNLKSNCETWVWAETKTGELLNKPKKGNDHCPHAIIYFIGTNDKYDGTY